MKCNTRFVKWYKMIFEFTSNEEYNILRSKLLKKINSSRLQQIGVMYFLFYYEPFGIIINQVLIHMRVPTCERRNRDSAPEINVI